MADCYLRERDAEISEDGLYRYWLLRRLARTDDSLVMFIGLNPSIADALIDDPTIRRCAGFAMTWAFDWLVMANLYAYRSTDPKNLQKITDPVGPKNEEILRGMAPHAECIVAAWGSEPLIEKAQILAEWVLSLPQTVCLGRNKNGSPKHPLYLPKTSMRVRV